MVQAALALKLLIGVAILLVGIGLAIPEFPLRSECGQGAAVKETARIVRFDPAVVVIRKRNREETRKGLLFSPRYKGLESTARFRWDLSLAKLYKKHSGELNALTMKSERTKYEIACAVAERLPELATRLAPTRKIWQSEDYRMSIFDAATLGVAYFARSKRAHVKRGENITECRDITGTDQSLNV